MIPADLRPRAALRFLGYDDEHDLVEQLRRARCNHENAHGRRCGRRAVRFMPGAPRCSIHFGTLEEELTELVEGRRG